MDQKRLEFLQRMPIFGGIRADILEFICEVSPLVSVPAGGIFFREDEPGDAMYVLEVGKVEVLKRWQDSDYPLQTLDVGDCFGEMAVIDHCPRSASVRAIEDCMARRISAADLYRVYARDLKQFTLIQMNMGREVCRRLRAADSLLFGARMGLPAAGHIFRAD